MNVLIWLATGVFVGWLARFLMRGRSYGRLGAEMEILRLHVKLDELRERDWLGLLDIQRQQLELLTRLAMERSVPSSSDGSAGASSSCRRLSGDPVERRAQYFVQLGLVAGKRVVLRLDQP